MTIAKHTIALAAASLGVATLLLSAHAVQPLKIDFSDETIGTEPKSFLSVVGVWLVVTVALVAVSHQMGDNTNDNLSLPGTNSQRATDTLDKSFPTQANGTSPIVLHAPSGKLTDSLLLGAMVGLLGVSNTWSWRVERARSLAADRPWKVILPKLFRWL